MGVASSSWEMPHEDTVLCSMRHGGRCSMQLAGGSLIHKLYPLTFSVATRPLSAFAGRRLVVKQCANSVH